jgi:hypothetical protein
LTGKSLGKCANGFQNKSSATTENRSRQEPEMARKRMNFEMLVIVAVVVNVAVITFDLCVKLRQSMMWMLAIAMWFRMFVRRSVSHKSAKKYYFKKKILFCFDRRWVACRYER